MNSVHVPVCSRSRKILINSVTYWDMCPSLIARRQRVRCVSRNPHDDAQCLEQPEPESTRHFAVAVLVDKRIRNEERSQCWTIQLRDAEAVASVERIDENHRCQCLPEVRRVNPIEAEQPSEKPRGDRDAGDDRRIGCKGVE